jgi:hypothetical protein
MRSALKPVLSATTPAGVDLLPDELTIVYAQLSDQDDILDNIGRGLDRQKAAAQGMHSEIGRQKVGFLGTSRS